MITESQFKNETKRIADTIRAGASVLPRECGPIQKAFASLVCCALKIWVVSLRLRGAPIDDNGCVHWN